MYIARSVASGIPLPLTSTYYPMPRLSSGARELYNIAYDGEYPKWNDEKKECHGRAHPLDPGIPERDRGLEDDHLQESDDDHESSDLLERDGQSYSEQSPDLCIDSDHHLLVVPQFYHRPDHDVESFFWVLLTSLLRAQPKNSEEDANLVRYRQAYDVFLQHSIREADLDSRTGLLLFGVKEYTDALHPELRDLAPMLRRMAQQIAPEYGYMEPPPALDHLHEAMRRLLLEQIFKMEKQKQKIELAPGRMRPLKDSEVLLQPLDLQSISAVGGATSSRTNKRKSASEGKKSTSKKAKRGYSDKSGRLRHLEVS